MRSTKDLIQYMVLWIILLGWAGCLSHHDYVPEDSDYWMKQGKKTVMEALKPKTMNGIAKNVILFIGDGMGLSTITAARIFKGQQQGKPGEEGYLTFEKFPHVALVKTYNVDRQVPDSAGTATALFSGIKGNYYTVGLNSHGIFNVCNPEVEQEAKVSTLLDWAISAGKSTGLVTTTRITHATPAASFGHSPHRDWECDSKIPEEERQKGCKDLGRQLVEDEPGRNINVILGGGAQVLRGSLNDTKSGACIRGDHKDLIWEWMTYQQKMGRNYKFVQDWDGLMSADNDAYILGLFANSHMPYDKDRTVTHPSLSDMVSKAIDVIGRNDKGFVLIVEGGRIDHAHHDNLAKIAMEEVVALDKAIETALGKVKLEETIIVVTADHSHSMSINGYPKRGNPIEGVGDVTPEGFAYQTLSYINGPGYNYHRVLDNLENINGTSTPTGKNLTVDKEVDMGRHLHDTKSVTSSKNLNETLKSVNTWRNLNLTETEKLLERYEPHHAGYWMDYETHGGEDVPVYAIGPMAHLLYGVHEQTHVPFTIAYAACIGPYEENCRPAPSGQDTSSMGKKAHHNSASRMYSTHTTCLLIISLGVTCLFTFNSPFTLA